VSAHVVPKAKPFSEQDPEEKTTLESQWEDEASTTVEQGDVADKIRALGVEPRRQAGTGANRELDEPTVDDQHVNAGFSGLTPQPGDHARLVITQGNDLGRDVEIRLGKTYTIGRGLDNDFVLSDIAVSRKHFDLRSEDGSWVIVDRGSGNGTLVNGNIEDNPFMLANGDLIEIGNTVFRFEHPNGLVRRPEDFHADIDDDEMSTVAGKPLRDPDEAATPVEQPLQRLDLPREHPPAVPLRPPPNPSSSPYAPMPHVTNRGPLLGPGHPTLLADGPLRTTLPGTAPARPSGYPQATEIPPHSVHAQMLKIAAQQQGLRHDPSTALVSPTPYNSMPHAVQLRQYVQPQLSRRSKMLLAAAAVSALAAILTIAILKSGSSKPAGKAGAGSAAADATPPTKPGTPPAVTPPKPASTAPAATPKQVATTAPSATPKQEPPKQEPPKQEPPKQEPPKQVAQPTPPKQEPPKQEPPKQEPPKQEPPKQVAQATPAKQEPKDDKPKPAAATTTVAAARPKKATPPPTPPPPAPAPRKVATADLDSARSRADEAYRAKRFSDAANIMAAAARTAPDDEAKQLRHRADLYESFRRAYNAGTAPGAKATDAFARLREAIGADNALGRAFDSELTTKLGQVAPRAATQFLAHDDFASARLAVVTAESFGGANETTKIVRSALDRKAADLYGEASKEAQSNPDDARDKCRKIKDIVDPTSNYGAKAKKLLAQLGG
jgi:pSer/pThr/pTyr-binding forkhead associated (FHA) protein